MEFLHYVPQALMLGLSILGNLSTGVLSNIPKPKREHAKRAQESLHRVRPHKRNKQHARGRFHLSGDVSASKE